MRFMVNRHFWLVLWHGVKVAWTAAKVVDQIGLPLPVQFHQGVRIAEAIEQAASVNRLVQNSKETK